jgi:hypothetical protein
MIQTSIACRTARGDGCFSSAIQPDSRRIKR